MYRQKNIEEQKKPNTQAQTFLRETSQDTLIDIPAQAVKERKSLFATIINYKKSQEVMKKSQIDSMASLSIESCESTQRCSIGRKTETTRSLEEYVDLDSVTSTTKPKNFLQILFQKARSKNNGRVDSEYLKEGIKRENPNRGQGESNAIMLYFNNSFPTSYTSSCNVNMVNGIAEIQDIISNLCENENYMIQCIKKYILDVNFKEQLLQTSRQYFTMQEESKDQATTLVNKMWLNQLQVTKLHERNLQKNFDFLVKQNRALQKKLEVSRRTFEMLGARMSLGRSRFSHASPFGRTFSKHIIDNNKELQKKVEAMVTVIENLESELQKLQRQIEALEDENRSCRSSLQTLAAALERTKINSDLQITYINQQTASFKQSVDLSGEASKDFMENLKIFEQQMNNIPLTIRWPKFQYQRFNDLPQLIGQCKDLISDFVKTLVTTHNNTVLIKHDASQLRENNTRLQEHLKMSTDELNCLTRKFEDAKKLKDLETKCIDFQQDINGLKRKLKQISEKYENLTQEFEGKNKALKEATCIIKNSTAEKTILRSQIERLISAMSQSGAGDVARELVTSQEKLEYFHSQYIQESTDKKYLLQKCADLEEQNATLVKNQQIYIQQYLELQKTLEFLTGENTLLKNQFDSEHQTVITLQGERVKYLEEKNILRTIFQHLKAEILRVQQLEGTIADMNHETSRLTLIVEYNKQLGEKLKSEVELKDNAILELKSNVQKLNDLQLHQEKDNIFLCAKLSHISNVKGQLHSYLKKEIKKNEKLDETKKLIEVDTENKIKILQQMHKSERVALKELLKDFRDVVNQRDTLLKIHENCIQENAQLKNYYRDQMEHYEEKQKRLKEAERQIDELNSKLQRSDSMLKNLTEKHENDAIRTDKCTRQLERTIRHITKEKEELSASIDYLKKNTQKLHNDLNEAREKEKNTLDLLNMKSVKNGIIKEELIRCKNDLQNYTESNIKLTSELDYVRNMYEKQRSEFQATMDEYSLKDQDINSNFIRKQEEIDQLNKIKMDQEHEISILEEKVKCLCTQKEEQDKMLQSYEIQIIQLSNLETSNLELEKELDELQVKYEANRLNLDEANKEIDNLNNNLSAIIMNTEDKDSLYKNHVDEIFIEYNKEKTNVEAQIKDISIQLQEVTDGLNNERILNQELTQSYDRLKAKLFEVKSSLCNEISLHKVTCCKLAKFEENNKLLTNEKDKLQQQIYMIMVEMNEEKDVNNRLSLENEDMLGTLECGRRKFNEVLAKTMLLENELRQQKYQIDDEIKSKNMAEERLWKYSTALEEQNKKLQELKNIDAALGKELEECRKELDTLKENWFKAQHQATEMEFKNCELTLQLHELEIKFETERNMYFESMESQNQQNLLKITKSTEGPVVPSSGER